LFNNKIKAKCRFKKDKLDNPRNSGMKSVEYEVQIK